MHRLVLPGLTGFLQVLASGLIVGALLATIGYPMGREMTAYLIAIATAVALGARPGIGLGLGGDSAPRRSEVTGLALVAAGFVMRGATALNLHLLVQPFWAVGLLALFHGRARAWQEGAKDSTSRIWTAVLGVLCIGMGYLCGEGLFYLAGTAGTVTAAYALLEDSLPGFLPPTLHALVMGAFVLALVIIARAHAFTLVRLFLTGSAV